jgi:hypothetical protein
MLSAQITDGKSKRTVTMAGSAAAVLVIMALLHCRAGPEVSVSMNG